MNKDYLKETTMLNFTEPKIDALISSKAWSTLDSYHKIGAIYAFVQNDIVFGYNTCDTILATQVLKDGFGQCNTKATLLMALLRCVGIPCRLHAFYVSKAFQRGASPLIIHLLAPPKILHTWVEVWYDERWVTLEGVITDLDYLNAIQAKFPNHDTEFQRYAIATKNLKEAAIEWKGKDTYIQKEAIVQDLGIFSSPDELFSFYQQPMSKKKAFLYAQLGCHLMTRRVSALRKAVKSI